MSEEEILAYIDSTMANAIMSKLSSQPIMSNEINVPMLMDRLQFYMESIDSNSIKFTVTDNVTGYYKNYIFNIRPNSIYSYSSSSGIPF